MKTMPVELQEISKGVSVEKRNEVQTILNQVFNGVSKMREQLDNIVVEDENDKFNMDLARTSRLAVRQQRLSAEKTFDAKRGEVQQKMLSFKTEDSLWLKAKQTMQILTKEIEDNAKWKEETAKRFKAEQKELKLKQRELSINKFELEIERSEYENMSDDTFSSFLSGIEKDYNEKKESERLELERIEKERLAKEKAIEEQRLENLRLKKEAEERVKQEAIIKEAENKRNETAKARQEMLFEIGVNLDFESCKSMEQDVWDSFHDEKNEAYQKEKNRLFTEKKKADAEAKREKDKLIYEQKERNKLQAKLDAQKKQEAEELARLKTEQEAKDKEALRLKKAPIREKLNLWVDNFEIEDTDVDNEATKVIKIKFEAFKAWAKTQVKNI